ncbi:MAG: type II toxin-antitoxin system PemK/MazF family toxin [Candidatus Adiutrix sp.]|jgi:mRNA interferase MazF|nr:type II toxin-antitoxin system PemK/MazF family toxin [Candidatus Adiutrix sp.]
MAGFVKGDVVVVPFPFSDLSSSKRRPALVLAKANASDLILSQITSKSVGDEYAVELITSDFSSGGLNATSNVRPNKLRFIRRRLFSWAQF